MGVTRLPSTDPSCVTPICSACGITLCWDITEVEYAENKAHWDEWQCSTCRPQIVPLPKKATPPIQSRPRNRYGMKPESDPTMVTIVADASHDSRTKAAGFGFWIAGSRGRHGQGGAFKRPLADSVIAEILAIVNAVHVARKRNILLAGDKLLIQTDCQAAINLLGHFKARGSRTDFTDARAAYLPLVADLREVEFRHVKGHSKVKDARSLAQRHSDRRARKGMRTRRDEIFAQRRTDGLAKTMAPAVEELPQPRAAAERQDDGGELPAGDGGREASAADSAGVQGDGGHAGHGPRAARSGEAS